MGTRGYLIFKYKGIYYVIYNHWDSYPSCMGVNNAKSIKELCKKFNGNIALAREYLGKILEGITFIHGRDYDELENANELKIVLDKSTNGFDIDEMSQPNAAACLSKNPSNDTPKSDGLFIEYMWEVDIDEGRFGMGTSESGTVFHYWPWKALYLLPLEEFKEDAELHETKFTEGYLISCTKYEVCYKTSLIQAAVRRFLAIRKALQPPNGFLYLKAKKEFEGYASSSI